jgi:hypothetical protein
MPAEEIGEFVINMAANVVIEFVPQLVFNRFVARYFHGIGRHAIALASFGQWRIPSSLRVVAPGAKAKPNGQDWFALCVGIVVWGASLSAAIFMTF